MCVDTGRVLLPLRFLCSPLKVLSLHSGRAGRPGFFLPILWETYALEPTLAWGFAAQSLILKLPFPGE